MNPYLLLAAVLAWGASAGGAFLYGQHVGAEHELATQTRLDQNTRDTREASQKGAAEAIAKLKPVNRTVVQKTEKEIHENTVYADCRVPASGVRFANEAITGRPAEPAGGVVVPGAIAAP
jgi:hypothetical protein